MKIFYFCVSNKLKSYQFSHLKDRNYCFVVSQKLVTIHIVPRSARSILKVKVRTANPCYAWKVKKPNSIPLTSQLIRIFAWKSEFSETDEGEGRFVQLRTRKLPNAWNFLTLYNFVKNYEKDGRYSPTKVNLFWKSQELWRHCTVCGNPKLKNNLHIF